MKDPALARMSGLKKGLGESRLRLGDDSRVAVIGGGPAGSYFSYFLLEMADKAGIEIEVHIYEPRDYRIPGPNSCNMCGGIVSESMVQAMATESMNLPSSVIQRGIDSYVMHMDVGRVQIKSTLQGMRIGTVHRGAGPRDLKDGKWESFDGFLLSLAEQKGASHIKQRVTEIEWKEGCPVIKTKETASLSYDLLAVAIGINSSSRGLFDRLELEYTPPITTKTFIREYYFGEDAIEKHLGNAMQIFLLDIPRLKFAAAIPKGDYVTICLLGEEIDNNLLNSFLHTAELKSCMPPGWNPDHISCQCAPRMNIHAAKKPYGDRIVFLGDSGVTRLYKDGIGGAYRTAKAAADTAIFHGISSKDFARHFWPTCRQIDNDNKVGRLIFRTIRIIQKASFLRRAILNMTAKEQNMDEAERRMSMILWDMFTGSAAYADILWRSLYPVYLLRFGWEVLLSLFFFDTGKDYQSSPVEESADRW